MTKYSEMEKNIIPDGWESNSDLEIDSDLLFAIVSALPVAQRRRIARKLEADRKTHANSESPSHHWYNKSVQMCARFERMTNL